MELTDVADAGGPPPYDIRGRIVEPPVEIPAWVTVTTAAKMLGIANFTLYDWIERGYGPPVYSLSLKHYLYKKDEVEIWIEKRRQCLDDPIYRVLPINEAATRLGVHRWRLHKLIQDGKGPPAFIFNGRYVVRETEFEKWRDENWKG